VTASDFPDDIDAWRRATRIALLNQRANLDKETLEAHRLAIDGHIERCFPWLRTAILAFCWPHRNEYDALPLTERLRAAGATTLLPVVVAPKTALLFREWHPGVALADGPLGIPFPASSPTFSPTALLLPMAGFDNAGYRLGYGGGYFDRTIAALPQRPAIIGVAHELARIPSIRPQPHDIPMDYVVTEQGAFRREGERLAAI
jgi:5-formyltetrahydrofolate cyclo-ligase